MENQTMTQDIFKTALEDVLKGANKETIEAFMTELNAEERDQVLLLVLSLATRRIDEAKNLALLGIFASMSALALVGIIAGWHVGEIEDEMRAPIKKAIDARINAMLKASLEDPALRSEEAFRKHVANALTDLGYADYKWQRKYINKKYGKKLF